jgi:predicted RNA binding protein YcfA (HicA-like mRNA interferase family)
MSKYKKIISKILSGQSDSNILFEDLLNLLINLGFEVRVRGSHHLFHKAGVMEKINLQKDNKFAKPYQVKQVRKIILKYKLGGLKDV